MQNIKQSRPFTVYVLIALLIVLGISALAGGVGFLGDPSGKAIGIPLSWLKTTPFTSFFIPGLILFTVLGIFPLIVTLLLFFKPHWSLMHGLEQFTHEHWSWLASLTVGIALIIWIAMQFLMFGARHPIQIGLELTLGTLGIVIIAVSLLPSVRRYYALP